MKNLLKLSLLSFILLLVFSCDKEDDNDDKNDGDNNRNPQEQCQTTDSGCGEFTACCTGTECYYLYQGTEYPCDGLDCQEAAQQLATDMCGDLKSGNELDATVEQILDALPCTK